MAKFTYETIIVGDAECFAVFTESGDTPGFEDIGVELFGKDNFGTIDPPCCLLDFDYITEEDIENGPYYKWPLKDVRTNYDTQKFLDDLCNNLTAIFSYFPEKDEYVQLSNAQVKDLLLDEQHEGYLTLFEIEVGT